MTNTPILDQASSSLLSVTLTGTGGWTPNAKIKGAEDVLASEYGGSSKAFRGTENILPAPYNVEFLALQKSFGAVRAAFYEATMPAGHTTNAKGKQEATGERLVTASKLADGSFLNTLAKLNQELDNARTALASTIQSQVMAIQADGALGSRFDPTRYPSPSDILTGWRYEPVVPKPLTDGSKLKGMSLPASLITAIESQLEAQAASQIAFGQQSLVTDTLANIRTMADNLARLDQWFSTQQGKRPPIYETLVTNLRDSLAKLRAYALPDTPAGAKLLDLARDVEGRLDLSTLSASDLKNDHTIARRTAKEASTLADSISQSLDDLFAAGSPPARTAQPTAAPKLPDPPEEVEIQPEPAPIRSTIDMDDLLAEWA